MGQVRLAVFLALAVGAVGQSKSEMKALLALRGCGVDNANLTQKAAELTRANEALRQINAILIKQAVAVPELRKQVAKLNSELAGRPAILALPEAAQVSIEKARDQITTNTQLSVENGDLVKTVTRLVELGQTRQAKGFQRLTIILVLSVCALMALVAAVLIFVIHGFVGRLNGAVEELRKLLMEVLTDKHRIEDLQHALASAVVKRAEGVG